MKSGGSAAGRESDEERKGDEVPAPCVQRAALRRHFVFHRLDVHEGNHEYDLERSCKPPSHRTLGEEMRVHVLLSIPLLHPSRDDDATSGKRQQHPASPKCRF